MRPGRQRYFSGTAEYVTTLDVSAASLAQVQRLELDLGKVKNLAEVLINGHSAGIEWKPPFRLDISPWSGQAITTCVVA